MKAKALVGVIGALWLGVVGAASGQQPAPAQVVVEVKGLRNTNGQLRVGLFETGKDFPTLSKALKSSSVALGEPLGRLAFTELLPGDYAVAIHHDENSNGKMDMQWLPYPRPGEGVGASNDPRSLGQPTFDEARFTVLPGERKLVTITMLY